MQADSYLQGFSQLSAAPASTKGKSIEQLAKQFEGQFFAMLLKSARATAQTMGGDFLNSREMQMRHENYDAMIANQLSGGPLYQHFYEALSRQFNNQTQERAPLSKVDTQPIISNRLNPSNEPLVDNSSTKAKATDPVADIYNIAKQYAEKLGVSAKVIWAQSMLETGWAKHFPSDDSHNLFGIKARKGDDAVEAMTHEIFEGVIHQVKAPFKRYSSLVASFEDYVDLIRNSPRYANALAASTDREYIERLQQAGYATDPQYADKVISIMESARAKELD